MVIRCPAVLKLYSIDNLQVGHLPCLSAGRSMASLEALTGADIAIGFDDIYGKNEDFEMLPPLPFNAIQKTLDDF